MTVYWILPLFWDDGKLEFDCTIKDEFEINSNTLHDFGEFGNYDN